MMCEEVESVSDEVMLGEKENMRTSAGVEE